MKELLLYHWHCILPLVLVAAALLFLGNRNQDGKRQDEEDIEK